MTSYEDENVFINVQDLMSCDMRTLIDTMKDKQLYELHAKKIFYQMLLAIDHLDSKNIIHRDIQLESFLVRQNKK